MTLQKSKLDKSFILYYYPSSAAQQRNSLEKQKKGIVQKIVTLEESHLM